jgi:glycerophosphoryl diester phosphodiesterase
MPNTKSEKRKAARFPVVDDTPRPLLLGHRGVRPLSRIGARSEELPAENTVTAFSYALAHGCDGVEFDLRFTRDRHAVLCHDSHLDGKEISITGYSDLAQSRNGLACLEDVLARFADSAYLDIEVKSVGHEEDVVAALQANPPSRGYVVSSFLPEVLMRLHQLNAALPLGYICDRSRYVKHWIELPISVFIPQHELVSQNLIDQVHHRGLKLLSWTVNQRDQMLRLASWGIDGLISDDPALLAGTLLQQRRATSRPSRGNTIATWLVKLSSIQPGVPFLCTHGPPSFRL